MKGWVWLRLGPGATQGLRQSRGRCECLPLALVPLWVQTVLSCSILHRGLQPALFPAGSSVFGGGGGFLGLSRGPGGAGTVVGTALATRGAAWRGHGAGAGLTAEGASGCLRVSENALGSRYSFHWKNSPVLNVG